MARPIESEEYLILLVDGSDEHVRRIFRVLGRFPKLKVAWRVRDGEEAKAYLNGIGEFADREEYPWPDILVTELRLGKVTGFDILECVRRESPRPVIAVLTVSEDVIDKKRAMELGADMFEVEGLSEQALERFFHFVERIAAQKK